MSANESLIEKLTSPHVKALKPYESARRLFAGGQVWLNANESPFSNEYELDNDKLNRYPSCQPDAVVKGYAAYANLATEQVLVTRGADEGIELLIRAFCQAGHSNIMICPPTYGMYAISAQTFDVGLVEVPLNQDFSLDVAAIKTRAEQTKVNLVFICSPNNPTGTRIASEQLVEVLEAFADKALVVVDEAYIEFDAEHSWASKLAQYPNLVILRTLSKAFALAGLRCGFTLASSQIIQALLKVIAPYPIPEPVAQIAAQALSEAGINKMQSQVADLQNEQAVLKKALLNYPDVQLVGDDKANFILFRHPQKQALMDYLVAQGILIRDQSKQLSLDNCLRISIGSAEQNALLLAAMDTFFAQPTRDNA